MNKLAMAVGISAVLASVSPVLAAEVETTPQDFKAIAAIQVEISEANRLNDTELAKVEGAAVIGQVGLVNVGIGNTLNNNNVEVVKNVNAEVGANVQVLSAGGQLIRQ